MDMYQGLTEEDLKRLRRADVMYIAQLIEDNEKLKNQLAHSQSLLRNVVKSKAVQEAPLLYKSEAWAEAVKYIKNLDNVNQ